MICSFRFYKNCSITINIFKVFIHWRENCYWRAAWIYHYWWQHRPCARDSRDNSNLGPPSLLTEIHLLWPGDVSVSPVTMMSRHPKKSGEWRQNCSEREVKTFQCLFRMKMMMKNSQFRVINTASGKCWHFSGETLATKLSKYGRSAVDHILQTQIHSEYPDLDMKK